MRPHTFGHVRVDTWDVDGNSANDAVDALECVDLFLVEMAVGQGDEVVTDLEQFGGTEAPLTCPL